jgi:D-serine deaminase-like pyridoxal phosphate-dependent protein
MITIEKPTLVLDRIRCQENIRHMTEKASRHGLVFRPHFKTHQSRIIGRWFRDAGVRKITVSSVTMASYFIQDGWDDITIAFPVNILEIRNINELTSRATLNFLISSSENVDHLDKQLARPVGVFIETDTGYGRSGIDVSNTELIGKVMHMIRHTHKLELRGFLGHTGQTYHAVDAQEVLRIHDETLLQLRSLKSSLGSMSKELLFSLGDTPACSLADNFDGIDEIRPGNFVFYDLMQKEIGSCAEEQVAVCALCPVVARYPERNEVIIYGGAVHLSKDFIEDRDGKRIYGRIVHWNGNSWSPIIENCLVSSLSQEHGKIHAPGEMISQMVPGSLIGVIPVHSCLTADLMKGYLTTEGESVDHMSGKVEELRRQGFQ